MSKDGKEKNLQESENLIYFKERKKKKKESQLHVPASQALLTRRRAEY
jgi:hypothetical protein